VKIRKATDLVSYALEELSSSRSLRVGMLEMAEGEAGKHRRLIQNILVETDAEAAKGSDWLLDPAALSRAGVKKLLKGWHDAAALASVEATQLGRYDLVQHPDAIIKVDRAQSELRERFPEVYEVLQAACAATDLPPLLYCDVPQDGRRHAAQLAVRGRKPPGAGERVQG
jgi:hypothetical protein